MNIHEIRYAYPRFLEAVESNDVKFAEVFLEFGGIVFIDLQENENEDGKYPLAIAVEKGNVEMTRLLLKKGANPRLPIVFNDDRFNDLAAYLLEYYGGSICATSNMRPSRMGYLYLAICYQIELMKSPDKESELLPKIEDILSLAM